MQLRIYNPQARTAGIGAGGPALQRPMDIGNTAGMRLAGAVLHGMQGLGAQQVRRVAHANEVRLATQVVQAGNEYEDEARAFEADLYARHRGADAARVPELVERFHEERRQEYVRRFDGDERAQLGFLQRAGNVRGASLSRGMEFARREDEQFRADTLKGNAARLFQLAAETDDQQVVDAARGDYARAVSAAYPGRDMTAHLAELDRAMTGNAIRTRLAGGDVDGARRMLDERRGLLGTDFDTVSAQVRREEDTRHVITTAEQLSSRFGANIAGALGWVRANESDPLRRQALEQQVRSRWSMDEALRERAARQARASRLDAAYKDVMGAPDPKAAGDIIARLPVEEQAGMFVIAQRRFAGTPFPTDPVKAVQARDRILAGEEFSLEGEYGAHVNEHDLAELRALRGSEERKAAGATDREMLEAFWRNSGLPESGADAQAAKARVRLEFERRVREEHANTTSQREDILFELLAPRTVEGGWFGLLDRTVTAPDAARREMDGGQVRYAVPDDAREAIVAALRAGGIDPTEDNIEAAYVRNRRKFQW